MFAVVQVFQDYDYVEGVECVKVFRSEQECYDYIQDISRKSQEAFAKRNEYTLQYIAEKCQPFKYERWEKFKSRFHPLLASCVDRTNFVPVLCNELMRTSYLPDSCKDYDPPPEGQYPYGMHVVKLTELPV